jgi:hypothetical protein
MAAERSLSQKQLMTSGFFSNQQYATQNILILTYKFPGAGMSD